MAPSPIGDITMKTVLITGATGNIGQKLRENLEATGK
jgi:short-subunit dehydrogenase